MQANTNTEDTATNEVVIEKLVYGGDGLARVNGQVMLTPFVLPGERVTVAPQRAGKGLLRGRDPVILQPAEQRVTPRCEYFGTCGGCQYQHASYEFQLKQKVAILRETLSRTGGITFDGEIGTVSADPWFYRNRIQLHFADGESGFNRAGSHDLCGIERCYISSPVLVDAIGKFAQAVKEPEWPRFLRSLELFTNGEQLQLTITDTTRPVAIRFFEWCGTWLPNLASGAINYDAAGFQFQISRGSFFQVNRFLVDALADEVLSGHAGGYAVDLYAGVGLFTLRLAKQFERVEAVERGGAASRDLQANAARYTPNVMTSKSSAEDFLRDLDETPDLIVADPPRAGLGSDATAELLRIGAKKLTVVSCDPATLSRDVKKLLTRYRIEKLTLVDLFPQTYHFEVVAQLALNS